jgi:hypothetical protein
MFEESELTVISLSVDVSLLPEWFEAIEKVAAKYCRRMQVIEKPDEHLVHIELPVLAKPNLNRDLMEAWEVFVASRKAEGRWDE